MEEGAEGSEEGQAGSADADLTSPTRARALSIAAAPYAVVTVVGLFLTRSFWFPGSYVVAFDTYAYSGPNLEVTERALRSGHLPILNDLIFGGVPHLGNPSAAALYPPQVLAFVFGTNRGMGLLVAAHVVLLGIGMLVLARRLGLQRLGATTAAIVAVAAGATLTKTVQFEQILVLAWIPLLLVAIHAVLTSPRPWRAVAALSATTAAILLAGHPQLVYEAAVLAGIATVGFAWDDGRWRRISHVVAGAALGVCIALPQLVAVLYATADSAIVGGRDMDALRSPALSLPTEYMARALFGTVQNRDPAEFASGFESIVFLGVAASVLIAIGLVAALVCRRSRPWAVAFTVVAALSLTWATGPRSVVFRLAFDIVPGFDLARASARWLVVVALVGAVFAGVGVDAIWIRARRRHLLAVIVATIGMVGLLTVGPFAVADRRSAALWAGTAFVMIALLTLNALFAKRSWTRATSVAILVVASLELLTMSVHSVPQRLQSDTAFTSYRTATTDFLADQTAGLTVALTDDARPAEYEVPGMRPNANVLVGVPSIDGYDGGVQITSRWAEALRRFTPDPPVELPLRNSLSLPIEPGPLGRLGVRFILLDQARAPDVFIPGWTGPLASDENFSVWENPTWLGDAVAWSSAIADDHPADLLRTQPSLALDAAIVADPADAFDCAREATVCEPVGLTLERPRPERIDVAVDLDDTALVSVAQQALPGWSVEVDGTRADVIVVDGIFLGVQVSAGDHTISFTYASPWLRVTLVVALLALLATIALALAGNVRSRPRFLKQRAAATDQTC